MESQSSVITALKGRTTHVHFQPSPPDTSAMALSSSPPSPSSSAPLAMTTTWQQRLPSWSIPKEEREAEERAFRPPERTESQKYDAWKDIFQRAEHYKNNFRKVPGELSLFEEGISSIFLHISKFDKTDLRILIACCGMTGGLEPMTLLSFS